MSSGTLSVTQTCLVQSDPCYSTNIVYLLFSNKPTIVPPNKGCREEIFFGCKKLYIHVPGNLCGKDTDVIQPCVVGGRGYGIARTMTVIFERIFYIFFQSGPLKETLYTSVS